MNDAVRSATVPTGFAAAPESVRVRAAAAPFASCEVFEEMQCAREPWAEIDKFGRASPYQRYEFVEAWQRTIGRANAVRPMIVVARDEAGRVSAVVPLGRRRRGLVWTAEFLGGAHANFKMGLFRPGLETTSQAIVDLLRRAARMTTPRVDLFWLTNQPISWQGAANPMALLPRQPSPSFGYKTALAKDFNLWLRSHHSKAARRKLRKKSHRLNASGPLSLVVAQDAASARRMLAAFFRQKEARTRAIGLGNPYGDEQTARFFDIAATTTLAQGAPVLELHALMSGERIVATFGGVASADRFCGMIISYDLDPEISRCSPGQLLIVETIRSLSARGFATFDLGVGEAQYKDSNCEADEPLFDAAIAVSAAGLACGGAAMLSRRIKRRIKRTPWARSFVDFMRRTVLSLRRAATQIASGA